jgi:hypothetical protein
MSIDEGRAERSEVGAPGVDFTPGFSTFLHLACFAYRRPALALQPNSFSTLKYAFLAAVVAQRLAVRPLSISKSPKPKMQPLPTPHTSSWPRHSCRKKLPFPNLPNQKSNHHRHSKPVRSAGTPARKCSAVREVQNAICLDAANFRRLFSSRSADARSA